MILKTLSTELAKPRKGRDGVGSDSRARRGQNEIDRSGINNVEVEVKVEVNEVGKKVRKLSKSKNSSKSKKTVRSSDFLTPGAKLAFIDLSQAFFMAPILYHFNPEPHIRIETDVSGYTIGEVLSQLTLDNLGQWDPVAFFSYKMIPAETRYEMHNG